MAELKPCPFCGADSKPFGKIMRTDREGVWKHWKVGCVLDGFTIYDVEAWNRRVNTDLEEDDES